MHLTPARAADIDIFDAQNLGTAVLVKANNARHPPELQTN
jgi:hypothetical protein